MDNNPVSTPAIPPQLPTEPTKLSSSKVLLISLAVLEVVTLLVAIYFGYQYFQLKKQVASPQTATLPTPNSALPSPTNLPTISWETYANGKFNYQIKYPKDWTAKSTEPGPPAFDLVNNSRGFIVYPNVYEGVSNAKAYLTIETDGPQNQAYSSYEKWLESVNSSTFFTRESSNQATFAGVPATIVSGNYDGYGFPANIKAIYFRSKDSNTYFSVVITIEKNSNYQQVIDQILQTFEFSK